MDVASLSALVEAFARLLSSLAVIAGAVLVLWFLWQLLQIGRNLKEYGLDYTGFLRGEIQAAADKQSIKIKRPGARHRQGKFAEILNTGPKTLKDVQTKTKKDN